MNSFEDILELIRDNKSYPYYTLKILNFQQEKFDTAVHLYSNFDDSEATIDSTIEDLSFRIPKYSKNNPGRIFAIKLFKHQKGSTGAAISGPFIFKHEVTGEESSDSNNPMSALGSLGSYEFLSDKVFGPQLELAQQKAELKFREMQLELREKQFEEQLKEKQKELDESIGYYKKRVNQGAAALEIVGEKILSTFLNPSSPGQTGLAGVDEELSESEEVAQEIGEMVLNALNDGDVMISQSDQLIENIEKIINLFKEKNGAKD